MCDCPSDWVVCFKSNCERAEVIRKVQKEQVEKALDMLGDPRVGVSCGKPVTEHRVKSWIHLFQPAYRGEKTHDLRPLDRDYKIGDILVLQEYDKMCEAYTGREKRFEITYITSHEHTACAYSPSVLPNNFGIFSIKPIA